MNKIICEKCGAEMQPIDPKFHCGMMCPQCGWGWATTSYDPMLEDNTEYCIILQAGNSKSEDVIKVLSHITGQNYLNTRKMITDAPIKIYSGRANLVNTVIQELDIAGIQYETDPEFPY